MEAEAGLRIVILAGQAQVEGDAADGDRIAERIEDAGPSERLGRAGDGFGRAEAIVMEELERAGAGRRAGDGTVAEIDVIALRRAAGVGLFDQMTGAIILEKRRAAARESLGVAPKL